MGIVTISLESTSENACQAWAKGTMLSPATTWWCSSLSVLYEQARGSMKGMEVGIERDETDRV